MQPAQTLLAIAVVSLLPACAVVRTDPPAARPAASREGLDFRKQEMTLHCGGVSYDLLNATPVRSARIYDLLSRETFTRRYFVVQAAGRPYAFKTEQLEGAAYPRKILVETRSGFRLVLLDGQGNLVRADPAPDLSD